MDEVSHFRPQHRDLRCIDQSERLNQHGEEQGQVFGSFDGKLVRGVIVDHFRDSLERWAVLSQNVTAVFALREFHVHETLAAPETKHTRNVIIPQV